MSEFWFDGALLESLLGLVLLLPLLLLVVDIPGPAVPDESMSSIAAKGSTSDANDGEASPASPTIGMIAKKDLRERLGSSCIDLGTRENSAMARLPRCNNDGV